jgi:hypothetical protein
MNRPLKTAFAFFADAENDRERRCGLSASSGSIPSSV